MQDRVKKGGLPKGGKSNKRGSRSLSLKKLKKREEGLRGKSQSHYVKFLDSKEKC